MGVLALAGMLAGGIALAEADQGAVALGGKLYDKWYKVVKSEAPRVAHPLYPAANEKDAADPASNWRCTACHGWDGLGAEGACNEGSHARGIKCINGMIGGGCGAAEGSGAWLCRQAGRLGPAGSGQFRVSGQIDWAPCLADKASTGDAAAGMRVFNTACIGCHGADGKLPKE